MNAVAVAVQHGLLERDEALACLLGAHAEARAGTGQLVLVSGEAGIGKTSLVHAFAATLGPSTRVLEGRCDGLFTPRPLSPFADIARATNGAFAAALERAELRRCSTYCSTYSRGATRSSSSRTSTGQMRRRSTSCASSGGESTHWVLSPW